MQKSNNQTPYKSLDISFSAAALTTRKVELVGYEQVNPYRFEFHLSPFDVCSKLYSDYINGKLLVSAKDVSDNVKMLKSLAKRGGENYA